MVTAAVSFVIFLIVICLLRWAITTLVPLPEPIDRIVTVLVVVLIVVGLLYFFYPLVHSF